MQFKISSAALLKHLSQISGAVVGSPVIPILENFLFELKDGILTVTASDLQTTMVVQVPVESDETASLCIPAKILMETLKNLPEQPLTIHIDLDTFAVEVASDNGRYKLAGENSIDFPKIQQPAKAESVDLTAEVLSKAISTTIFCTSVDDARPAMTGVLFQLGEAESTFVATDGHRLVRFRRSDVTASLETNLILPKKALQLLKSSLPSDTTVVTLSYNSNNAFFAFNNINLICRLIDERYPEYDAAIPKSNPFFMTVSRLELLNSLKRVDIYANKVTHQVRLKVTENEVVISAEDLDFSNEAKENIPCEYEGDPMEIGFNAKFLIEMLSNLDSNLVVVELTAPNKQGIIVPKKVEPNENVLMLVMPVMLNHMA